jgi:hypothetical protein
LHHSSCGLSTQHALASLPDITFAGTFANCAETSPARALDELAAMVSAGDMPGAQAAAATLAPFWDGALRARTAEDRGRVSGMFS